MLQTCLFFAAHMRARSCDHFLASAAKKYMGSYKYWDPMLHILVDTPRVAAEIYNIY
jgi:hypothetical protein